MRLVSVLTRHSKAQHIAAALQPYDLLMCEFSDWDTDQLGSFCGQTERSMTARETAALKAMLAADLAGTDAGIGSEGSFGGGPLPGVLPWQQELVAFYDADTGRVVTGVAEGPAPLAATTVSDATALKTLLERYPAQGWMVRSRAGVRKGLLDSEQIMTLSPEWPLTLEPDWRAMMSPLRCERIRQAAENLAARLQSVCPACNSPGFWYDKVQKGLPCADCDAPTSQIRLRMARCRCGHEAHEEIRDTADPYYCEYCNP